MKSKRYSMTNKQVVYSKKIECAYPISVHEWNKIKQLISGMQPPAKIWSVAYSICIGFFISGIFSLIASYNNESIELWLKNVYLVVTIISLCAGIIFLILDQSRDDKNSTSRQNVLNEMASIEAQYEAPEQDI